jgi:L-lysine exporter family protein LysE/ArgO
MEFEIIKPLFLGFSAGLLLSFGFGSVFFALVQSSIEHGFKAGVKISLGVCFGDLIMIGLALAGTQFLTDSADFKFYMRLFGGILLIGLGISQFRKSKTATKVMDFKLARFFYFFGKGFLLNVINPINFFSWIILAASLKSENYNLIEQLLFFSMSILAIFIIESLMAIYSAKLGAKLNENIILKIKKITGIIFIGIAFKLIFEALH